MTTTHQIHTADSIRKLTEIESNTIDAVITDPPYSSGGAHRSDRNQNTTAKYLSGTSTISRLPEFYGDNRTERGLLLWSTLWLAEAWRITKTGGAIVVFCDWRSFPTFSDAIQAGGWTWRGTGVWIKPLAKSRPMKGGLWNDTEYILWGSKGPRTEGECLPGSWQTPAPSASKRRHVTEKPQTILQDLVRLAPEQGVVLDPFAGSGSTAVAAATQNRNSINIELSDEYADIARQRVAQTLAHGIDVVEVGGSAASIFDQLG